MEPMWRDGGKVVRRVCPKSDCLAGAAATGSRKVNHSELASAFHLDAEPAELFDETVYAVHQATGVAPVKSETKESQRSRSITSSS